MQNHVKNFFVKLIFFFKEYEKKDGLVLVHHKGECMDARETNLECCDLDMYQGHDLNVNVS